MNSQDFSETGIFSVIPANRTCADLYMLLLTRCKCEGFDEEGHIKDNAKNQKWLAEFALGTLNDAIQKQYVGGNTDSAKKYGHGNCERLLENRLQML
ncbi:ligand-gated sodium channel [Desmophyllum pertusum]|uniref:Ligand-gated sodium channel n=1 Tax=Desmophyllum pertusum TaxID=174260 RepID=A0A9W9ZVM6_9CNID|nr:ligand-gated sodium channel [Desmophyllum pertusum]